MLPRVTIQLYIPREPQQCWRAFTDGATLVAWVPGLRSAQVIAKGAFGLPTEIHFEFGGSLVYTLIYHYDHEARSVRWEPKLGKRDGVTGSVRFDAFDQGTRLTYELEHGAGRDSKERALGDPQALVDAFAAWVTQRP